MPSSINTYLKNLSYDKFYLRKNSTELDNINSSKNNLLANLDKELSVLVKRRFVFGSYDRDTILPRSVDKKSDIDLMVVFNHTKYERTPETYRYWLKNFGDKYYKDRYGSDVVRDFPTVTIRLGSINYDLVPAKEESISSYLSSTIYIPDKNHGWQSTDPNDVKEKLTQQNSKYGQIVKPIVRLMKAWNCSNDYPYDSYALELEITDMVFYGDNIQTGFFYAAQQLQAKWDDSQRKKEKIKSLHYNINNVKEKLDEYDIEGAKKWLHRVIPL